MSKNVVLALDWVRSENGGLNETRRKGQMEMMEMGIV